MTTAPTTRVSLRDVREAAFRALTAHGASHGEARAASRMVLDAELLDLGGLAALLDDLAQEPWSRTPVQIASATAEKADGSSTLVLGLPVTNRLLREAPLALELLASDDEVGLVAAPCDTTGAAVLDTVALELARAGNTQIALVACPAADSSTGRTAQVRLARPDGDLGTGAVEEPPSRWLGAMTGSGVLAVRDVSKQDDLRLNWVTAADRAEARAVAAAAGLQVDAGEWANVYAASRRYLVPD